MNNDVNEYVEYCKKLNIISNFGWISNFDTTENKCTPIRIPGFKEIIELAPMALRYLSQIYLPNIQNNTLPFMNPLNPIKMDPIYGVPLGGIGCGTIGRGYKGEFCRSSLSPGLYCHQISPDDQFIVTIKRENNAVFQQVLSTKNEKKSNCWRFGFPADKGYYVGLYPRSWTAYSFPQFDLLLICEQISPIIPENYKDSSLPVAVFHWTILNFNTTEPVQVCITFNWRGPRSKLRPSTLTEVGDAGILCSAIGTNLLGSNDETSYPFDSVVNPGLRGCLLETRVQGDMPCCYGIAAKSTNEVHVTRCLGFDTKLKSSNGSQNQEVLPPSSEEFWNSLYLNLGLHDFDGSKGFCKNSLTKYQNIVTAVCASCIVPAAKSVNSEIVPSQMTLDFFLTWHMPRVHFRSARIAYRRRYTRWFSEDITNGTTELLNYAHSNWLLWRMAIEDWQRPILSNPNLPCWYKSALFNELYFISDGGTVWLDPLLSEEKSIPIPIDLVRSRNQLVALDPLKLTFRDHLNDDQVMDEFNKLRREAFQSRKMNAEEMGLFAYLEGHEYRMYNTYDVHFNASWALIKLWPKLQLAVNYDLADITLSEDTTQVCYLYKGLRGIRNKCLSVPHDCGDPEDDPWYNVNAYIMYPTDSWKDLNPKFILMTWRDWKLTHDNTLLVYMLPIVIAVIKESLDMWDKDNDGIIENGGFPDQTYDTWKTTGLGAYVGGLWISALYGVHEMLNVASKKWPDYVNKFSDWSETFDNLASLLEKTKKTYHEALWTGKYYNYEVNTLNKTSTILADQLSGHWYLRLGGAPADAILPTEKLRIALQTITDLNWKSVCGGKFGAINGIFPNSTFDISNMQAEEFWVAVNYCLASLLIMEERKNDGFALAGACFNKTFNEMGLHFQTPEAYTRQNTVRSLGYMRPLAIWSMHHALQLQKD